MATRDIKTRFKLEGEQQYKRAMTEAANAIKVLKSEQALAAAEFEASGDAQEYAAEQARILAQEIEQQKRAVKAAEDAIKDLTDHGVEPSSKQVQNWQTKLNNAKATLKKMESQLGATEAELADQQSATNKARTAYENAERKIKSLTDEEKLAEAQFKATGDQEQYAADKTRILREKIEAQEEAVAAAELAIKSMTDNGVDPASSEMVEWKNKLVTAKTKLATLETQLKDTEEEFSDQKTAVNNARDAYSGAEKKVKSLTKEEELAEAQFKATGDAEQLLADKTRILKEKIEAQKTAVKAAEDAIRALTDNGVDPASEEVQEWRDKLVAAKLGLTNLENRLDSVGDEVDEETKKFGTAGTGADDLKKSIDKVAEKVDFQNVISSIDGITSAFEKVISAAFRAGQKIWQFGVDAGKWADDIATAATQLDIDPETYQSWQYASQFIDTNVEDIAKSWQDIQKKLKENNTEYMGELAKLRVGVRKTNGDMRSSEDIFWDLIDAIHNIKDPTEQARVATQFFGNDWRTLKPLIESGSKAYKDLAEEGKNVAVVSNENVSELGALDDSMNKVKSQALKLKNEALAKLTPAFLSLSGFASRAMTSLDNFMNSAEGQETINNLNTAIEGLIGVFLGDDNGEGAFKKIIEAATEAINKFTKTLEWVSEHGDTVTGIIKGLSAAYSGMKVAKTVLQFMELLNKIPLAKLTTLFSGGAGAAGGAASAANAAAQATGGAAKAAASGSAPSIAGTFGSLAGVAGLSVIGYGWDKAIEARQGDQEKLIDTAEHLIATTEASNELKKALENWVKSQAAMEQADWDYWGGKITDQEYYDIIDKANAASEALVNMEGAGEVMDAYESWRTGNSIADWILPENWNQMGLDALAGLEEGIESGLEGVDEAGAKTGETLAEAAKRILDEHSPSRVFHVIGENAAVGLANGIYARGDEAIRAARWMAESCANIVQSVLDIHSPSRVFERMGEFSGAGFAQGIEGSAGAVSRAVDRMIGSTTRRAAASYGGISLPASGAVPVRAAGAQAGGAAGTVHVTMVLDDEVLGDVMAPIVNDKIGAKINATRR